MSDSSGSSSCPLKSSSPAPGSVHRPSSMTSSKDDLAGKDWLPKKDSSGALVGIGSLGGGSAFAKYVRKESSSQQRSSSDAATTTAALLECKTSSGEPETVAASDSQPSFTTNFHQHHTSNSSKPTLAQQHHRSSPPQQVSELQQLVHQHAQSNSHSYSAHGLTERLSSRPESSGRTEGDGDPLDDDDDQQAMSSSSDSENTHSKGNNSGSGGGGLKGAGSSGNNAGSSGKKRLKATSGEEPKSKKQRLIWTPELHARFLAAVNHLGVKNAVPKTILQLMNVEGMTRENVASHLQKYRLYLKRLAGLPANVPLSADTLQQVQTVQQALQQQVQAGFQSSHTLQLAAAGGVPLSLAGIPAVSLAGSYPDLVSQLVAANAAGSGASPSTSAAAAGQAGAAAGGLTDLQAGTLAALQRSQLVGAVGVLPGLLPIGFTPLSMAGLGGFNSAALLGGAAGGLGMVGQVSLANSGLMLQGGNVLAAQLNGAGSNGNQ